MKKIILSLLLLTVTTVLTAQKREFRGAWIQCVNGQFQGLSAQAMQQTLSQQLDQLQLDGVNAIIFQVRAECDALYASNKEPWSRFLTGTQGQAPTVKWDPLQWMVEQCHRRGMEIHAWINPYRAKTKGTTMLAPNHVARLHPEWVFPYDGQLILQPALPATRQYICQVVDDIVSRYDIDGLHIDDYFYPYPAAGQVIPDNALYQQMGRGYANINDWRRANVNAFIQQLSATIHARKPWVRFGVSPFGIYRNQSTDPQNGSATKGLQNYDDLYADVLLWEREGWVDYCVPQIYWQIGHPTADYATLLKWWDSHITHRPLYIGEDVERTVKFADPQRPTSHQMPAKFALRDKANHVQGAVLWYAKAVVDNVGNYGATLRDHYWKWPALTPRSPWLDQRAPKKPKKVKARWTPEGYILSWKQPKWKKWGDEVTRYVVYRFAKGERVDTEQAARIVTITTDTQIQLPYTKGQERWTYVVTALDRTMNESKGVKEKVKL